ncbi:hypothetical protein [Agrobacterium tumefaciens]|uniref:hypothetical protein n=1 Tax=Agrobacterium tumefaciens TaxID=358 RepID=UPI00157167C8
MRLAVEVVVVGRDEGALLVQAVCAPQPLVCSHWLDVVSGGNICDALTVFTARVHIRQHSAGDKRHVVSSAWWPPCG